MPQIRVMVERTAKNDEKLKLRGFKWCNKDCRYEKNLRKVTENSHREVWALAYKDGYPVILVDGDDLYIPSL